VLEAILTAPMVVTNWINMQYNASTVTPELFGSGDKVLHNVAGGNLGVYEGAGGDLRIGLALQSVHNGTDWVHQPLRLSVLVEATAVCWVRFACGSGQTAFSGKRSTRVMAPSLLDQHKGPRTDANGRELHASVEGGEPRFMFDGEAQQVEVCERGGSEHRRLRHRMDVQQRHIIRAKQMSRMRHEGHHHLMHGLHGAECVRIPGLTSDTQNAILYDRAGQPD